MGMPFRWRRGKRRLKPSDYPFLKRFLDVTKANLFFACGVMIVEGDGENILVPTLASLLGRDFTEHGVSIVNVGGVGLGRYARIFQRKNVERDGQIDVPVACIADMDVMPDCAPVIIGKVEETDVWPALGKRRWKAKRDVGDRKALNDLREEKVAKTSGQYVKVFVSDEWTFEYDLALGPEVNGDHPYGMAEDVFVAARLADEDEAINAKGTNAIEVEKAAVRDFAVLKAGVVAKDSCSKEEVLASHVYAKFTKDGVSKATAAQYLAERLRGKHRIGKITSADLRKWLPRYLTGAIDYVTRAEAAATDSNETNT